VSKADITADVAVLGAGPAGTALATLLARRGHAVHVFEREEFPRFHIGESLLPTAIPLLEEIGIDLGAAPYALRKRGAVFCDPADGDTCLFAFDRALPGTPSLTYQVERQGLDADLARVAEVASARILFGHTVRSWQEDEDGVTVEGDWGRCRARLFIDAGGHKAVFAQARRSRRQIEGLGILATYTHYRKVRSQMARRFFEQGDIVIQVESPESWIWLIPLPDDHLSIGRVQTHANVHPDSEETVRTMVNGSPDLQELLAGAERCLPAHRTSNYSFYNTEPDTPRTAALGDARGFLDPVFSSGVTLALVQASMMAEEIDAALRHGGALDLWQFREQIERAYATFERVIRRFYRPGWVKAFFFAEEKPDRMLREITSILAGDVWRDDNQLQQLMLKAKR
jgi:flavin-dependent dehydrogenase